MPLNRPPKPPSVHLRVGPDTHPPDERIEVWRAALGFSHDIIVAPEHRPEFRASLDGHHLGSILMADMRAGPLTAVRTSALVLQHAFDAIALDVVVEGTIKGRFGAKSVTVGPGGCVLMNVCETMRIDVTEHRVLTLIVPRALFAARVVDVGKVGGCVLPAGTPEARLVAGHLLHLFAVAADLPDALGEVAGLAALDVVAACLAPQQPSRRGGRKPADTAPNLARVERFILRNIARQSLGPEMICRHFSLSRASLYRLMQSAGGVAATIRRHRTDRAYTLLTSEAGRDAPLDKVARQCGFSDERTLRRVLRDIYKATPRALRDLGPERERPMPAVDDTTSAWIDAV